MIGNVELIWANQDTDRWLDVIDCEVGACSLECLPLVKETIWLFFSESQEGGVIDFSELFDVLSYLVKT